MPDEAQIRQARTVAGATSHDRDVQLAAERPHDVSAMPVGSWDAWTIAPRGEIDTAAVTRMQHEISDALTGYDRIVVDLRGSVLSTAAIALLCCALRRVHRAGARFVILEAAPAAHRALELCDLPGVQLHPPRSPLDVFGSTEHHAGGVAAHDDQQWVAA